MLFIIEDIAIGATLIALGALGLARFAVFFQNRKTTGDQFLSTSFASVLLVALIVSGGTFIGRAAFVIGGFPGILLGASGIIYLGLVVFAAWRLFGPRPEPIADRIVA